MSKDLKHLIKRLWYYSAFDGGLYRANKAGNAYFGATIQRGFALLAATHPGQIVLSQDTRAALGEYPQLQRDRAPHRLDLA